MARIDATLEKAIYDYVVAASGLAGNKVIWLHPDAPRPEVSYITLEITAIATANPRDFRNTGLDTFAYRLWKNMTVTVESYAKSSHMALLDSVVDGLKLPLKRETLRKAGLAFRRASPVTDISVFLNNTTERRASVQLELAYGVDVNEVTGEIQTVNYQGEDGMGRISGSETQP